MRLIENLSSDLGWRETQLASLRLLIAKDNNSPKQQEALLQAGWLMLYAHYEGFVKYALDLYYGEISKKIIQCHELPLKMEAFYREKEINIIKSLNYTDFTHRTRVGFFDEVGLTGSFPNVETKSNLWPDLLINLLSVADVDVEKLSFDEIRLKRLVARRNDIAHGTPNKIQDESYYLKFDEAVLNLLYSIAYALDDRLSKPPFSIGEVA